ADGAAALHQHDGADVVVAHQLRDLTHAALRIRDHDRLRHDLANQHLRRVYNRAAMATRTRQQLANRRRIETLIRLAAPVLDLTLYIGDRVSRVAGRNELPPEPARRQLK